LPFISFHPSYFCFSFPFFCLLWTLPLHYCLLTYQFVTSLSNQVLRIFFLNVFLDMSSFPI
jgi:hypothetical protein